MVSYRVVSVSKRWKISRHKMLTLCRKPAEKQISDITPNYRSNNQTGNENTKP